MAKFRERNCNSAVQKILLWTWVMLYDDEFLEVKFNGLDV
jgi:hypothetical protein